MQRHPQYTSDKSHRIISLPNGQWCLQRDSGGAGTKTSDPWINKSHPASYDEARVLLRNAEPAKAVQQ